LGEGILIVEDEQTLGENLAVFLAREGHRATAVGSGAEAMALLGRQSFDIVVTDIRLVDMDGLELLKKCARRSPAGGRGTVFLDEIGELPLHVQPKLLRALEEKEIMPIGSDAPLKVNTRIIAATHRDLDRMVEEGGFRQDLLLRINVVTIRIPPLGERVEDIPLLANHFVAHFCREMKRPRLTLDNPVMQRLMANEWRKGNVRELSNVIERAVILCEGDTIRLEDLPGDFQVAENEAPTTDLREAVKQFEYRHISSVLASVAGNRELAADALGISPATRYRHMERLRLAGYRLGAPPED
jgi:DNA-binding NtrC family response regulator